MPRRCCCAGGRPPPMLPPASGATSTASEQLGHSAAKHSQPRALSRMEEQPSIHSLPDDLLGRIFQLVRQQGARDEHERRGRPQSRTFLISVCRRWRAAYFSAPQLWRALRLQLYVHGFKGPGRDAAAAEWLASKRALLGRVGGLVCRLELPLELSLGEAAPWAWQATVEALQLCGPLSELHLGWPAHGWVGSPRDMAALEREWGLPQQLRGAAEALRRQTALTCLHLQGFWGAGLLDGMQQLQRLSVHLPPGARLYSTDLLAQIPRLPYLAELQLSTPDAPVWPAPDSAAVQDSAAAALARLPVLRSLGLEAGHFSPAELEPLRHAPQLTALELRCSPLSSCNFADQSPELPASTPHDLMHRKYIASHAGCHSLVQATVLARESSRAASFLSQCR
ncbi:hypothetical protein ABPG75_004183 [Micractinium tetrahymenae]